MEDTNEDFAPTAAIVAVGKTDATLLESLGRAVPYADSENLKLVSVDSSIPSKSVDDVIRETQLVMVNIDLSSEIDVEEAFRVARVAKGGGVNILSIVVAVSRNVGDSQGGDLSKLKELFDTVIIVDRDTNRDLTLDRVVDTNKAILDLVMVHGLICIDLADVKSLLGGAESVAIGAGISTGKSDIALEAAKIAVESINERFGRELLPINGLLITFTAGPEIRLLEISIAHEYINNAFLVDNESVNVIFGANIEEDSESAKVVIIAVN